MMGRPKEEARPRGTRRVSRKSSDSGQTTAFDSDGPLMLADWVRSAARRLSRGDRNGKLFFGHGALNAVDEAAWIAARVCRLSLARLATHAARLLTPGQQRRGNALVAERIRLKTPLAYLLGEAWLAGRRFKIDERVIVPRSLIAECLPEQIAPWLTDSRRIRSALDLCTGSGCLAILAACEFPGARVDAVDLSVDALDVARENINLHGLTRRVHAIESDLFSAIGGSRGKPARRYELILSNPPYVDAPSMRSLPAEYRKEPRLALAGGRDGLDLVRKILREAKEHLVPGGILVVEIGHNRRALERAFPRTPFIWLDTRAGTDKVFLLPAEDLPS